MSGGVNSTSTLKNYVDPLVSGVNYAATPWIDGTYKWLSEFSRGSDVFSNVNVGDCGDFTSCYPKPVGCTGDYTGRAGSGGSVH